MKPERRRRLGIAAGGLAGLALVLWLSRDGQAQLHAPGPMNTDHDAIACEGCHVAAAGSLRQQLQTAVRGALDSDVAVDVGYRAVTSDRCTACHEREDRHPIGRFLEPRFAEARAAIAPERCTSCHREHAGTRVTVEDAGFCRNCHGELALREDPLDVSHRQLVADARWDTCLGCHDYHGNHGTRPPRQLSLAVGIDRVLGYFAGGASPYPAAVHRARTEAP